MAKSGETFFTSVGCMDGRVQDVIAKFGRKKFGATFPDTVTDAGLVGILAKDSVHPSDLAGIIYKVLGVSIGKHNSSGVIVHGHAECAGNPVDDEKQKQDIIRSVEVIKPFVGPVPVVGVFVHRNKSNPAEWIAEEVTQIISA